MWMKMDEDIVDMLIIILGSAVAQWVECLTRDQGAAGSSLTDALCCVLVQDTLILA